MVHIKKKNLRNKQVWVSCRRLGKEFIQMTVSRGLERCLDCPC